MGKLNEWFKKKDKKTVTNLLAVLAIGLALLLVCGPLFGDKTDKTTTDPPPEALKPALVQDSKQNDYDKGQSYEADLEKRLEEILSMVDGAGEVKAMITLQSERELVIASDSVSSESLTKEYDNEGGTREISDIKSEERNILISDSGGSKPLILTENTPKIEGIIIIAQGGDNIIVRDALTRASQAVLGVDINKIQVLKMK